MRDEVREITGDYSMEMVAPGCTPGAPWWSARLHLDRDIRELLPYLNAELEGAQYHPGGGTLIWDSGKTRYAFRPQEIAIGPVQDREQAEAFSAEILDLMVDVWRRRDRIEPDHSERSSPPNVLDVYRKLPGTNCRECGKPSCFAFAGWLAQGHCSLDDCPALQSEEFAGNKDDLDQILGGAK